MKENDYDYFLLTFLCDATSEFQKERVFLNRKNTAQFLVLGKSIDKKKGKKIIFYRFE